MKLVHLASEGFGYSSNQITEGLWVKTVTDPSFEYICTNKVVHHGSLIDDLPITSEDDAVKQLDDADLILISSDGDMTFDSGVRGEVLRDLRYYDKVIFLDGHDSNHLLADPNKMRLYLKRELRAPESSCMVYPNVRGFTFGVYQFLIDQLCNEDDWRERDIDISFIAFGGSNPARKECADLLKRLNGANIGDRKLKVHIECQQDGQPVSIDDYRSLMRRSKVGISIIGAGFDTLRYWETMAHGAVLASMDISQLHIRDKPEPHRHAIYFDSWNRMVELCGLVVSNRSRWLKMRNAANKLLLKCHSTSARANTMIEMAQELE